MSCSDIQALVRAVRRISGKARSERELMKLTSLLDKVDLDAVAPALLESEELDEILGEVGKLRRAAASSGASETLVSCANRMGELAARVTFARTLRRERQRTGYGVRELARASGVSNAYISQIEHAQTSLPSLKVARKLAQVLGLSAEQLADFYPPEILSPTSAGDQTELLRDPAVQAFLAAAGALSPKERQMLAEIARVIRRYSKPD